MPRRTSTKVEKACNGRRQRPQRTGFVFALAFVVLLNHPGICEPPKATGAAVLSLDQVVAAMTRMNELRAEALRQYTSVRVYHLTLEGIVHRRADMVAKMTYRWPDRKAFGIISQSGSELLCNRVLKATMEAEQEGLREDNRKRTALTAENYDFAVDKVEGSPPVFYVLKVTPKIANKFVYKGRIWVDAQDFAVARIECEPAKNPSWWTRKNDITYTYQKVGDFWVPAHMQSVTDVRIFGRSILTIDYRDYQLIDARKLDAPSGMDDVAHPRENTEAPSPSSAQ